MLTNNFSVRPDPQGDLLQKYAAEIYAIDQHAIIPHDVKAARVLLAGLQQKQGRPRDSAADRRVAQFHEAYNAMLPVLARAKRIGVRPVDTKLPLVPPAATSRRTNSRR